MCFNYLGYWYLNYASYVVWFSEVGLVGMLKKKLKHFKRCTLTSVDGSKKHDFFPSPFILHLLPNHQTLKHGALKHSPGP